ncbi:MAG TPA: PP2C family protein-serine/threonine phosphatase [Acidimicrobiales bacterium]|nr:PP2C family protein-serine/threonine phosphatase [Acidimicrobiales bacterium]
MQSEVFPVRGSDDFVLLVRALVAARSVDEIAATVAQRAAATVGAPYSNLAVFDHGTNQVRVTHGPLLEPGLAGRWAEFPISAPAPLCEAILTGAPVLLASLDALVQRYPQVADDARAASFAALASVPLPSPVGTLGALGVAWSEPQEFGAAQVESLHVVADIVAAALYRAMAREQEVERGATMVAAEVLQRAFLPMELPHTERLDVAAAYLPAAGAQMGGDWYDLFPVAGGRTCLVVGDVAGHGLDAVASMGQLRNAIRAYADEDPTPARVLARANQMLCHVGAEVMASAIVAVWDPATHTLVRANAGHPPVLRCRPGEFAFLWPPHNVVLGAVPGRRFAQETTVLRPDTTIVLYTDGLIEVYGKSLDDTMGQLLRFVEGLDELSPRALCERVVEWRRGIGARVDDTSIIAARLS